MIHTCKCGHTGNPLCACARCGELVPLSIEPKRELESLRQQLQVARSQTKSDRELILELRGALETIEAQLHATLDAASADGRPNHIYKGPIEAQMLNARAVLGKVAP